MPGDYTPSEIEPKWQAYWDEHKTFRTPNPGEPGFDAAQRKFYALDMFPYPSGAGLHVGHPEGYTATDILSRYRRMCGDRVLHPMGWDAFGLPAEQHAVETGQHPAKTTEANINTFRRQLKSLGFSYDWDREVATTAPKYFRWTQWIFLKLFNSWFDDATQKARPICELDIPTDVKSRGDRAVREFTDSHRLAYLAEVPVNWCPVLGTVLSNEEVTNEGLSDRGNHPVFRRPMRQWMLRITKYADRLADDLAELDWPESIKLMQRNWIGRSEGAQVRFKLDGFDEAIEVFTTRPDTLFGATYMVLAPEHPLVEKITTAARRESVRRYCEEAARKSDLTRTADTKGKTGVFTGAFAINPVWPKEETVAPASRRCSPGHAPLSRIPILIADYVIMSYGTGAIMSVPAHDSRDFEFVEAYNKSSDGIQTSLELDVRPVVMPSDAWIKEHTAVTDRIIGKSRAVSWPESYLRNLLHFKLVYTGDGVAFNSPAGPPQSCGTGVSPVGPITDQEHITDRNLPHIQRGGCTYFVTFRVKNGELTSDERTVVLEACDHWHGKKATVVAAVVMPDHVHLLIAPHEQTAGEWVSLGEILHSIKSFSAHRISKARGRGGSVWLDESFDRVVRNEAEFVEKWEYIEANPVTASLVSRPSEYEWMILRSDVSFQETIHRRDAGATASKVSDTCDINGLPSSEAKAKITAWLEGKGLGSNAINYKLRDWLFSRQRYWGEPFPILHGPAGEIVALDESELPLELPAVDDYRPVSSTEDVAELPDPPLGRAKDWVTVERNGKTYRRELNTMPQWAGSCWYYLRFLDPHNDERFCSEAAEQAWMVSPKKDGTPHVGGIDLYLGGAEHAVLHLLYARFWHKVLYDLGYVSTLEPFGKLFNQGMIRSFAYTDSRGAYVSYDDIDFREDGAHRKSDGQKLNGAVEKMSKSLKNVINPDEVIHEYGADSLRLYEMFMGPLDASKPWNPRDVPGVFRFLQRAFRLIADIEGEGLSARVTDGEPNAELERSLHKTIKKVTEDLDRMAFNTAISAMMEFVNEAYRVKTIHKSQAERLVLTLSAFAPHLGEELWQRLRGKEWSGSLLREPWPTHDEAMLAVDEVEIPIQVNGKLVSRVTVAKDANEKAVVAAAQADEKLAARTDGGQIVKTIYVPGRMLNLIVKK